VGTGRARGAAPDPRPVTVVPRPVGGDAVSLLALSGAPDHPALAGVRGVSVATMKRPGRFLLETGIQWAPFQITVLIAVGSSDWRWWALNVTALWAVLIAIYFDSR
jgi:hypothetical protein